eukprot:scaffold1690_cov182-Amphora_coffeaeformis.AAC.41
MERRFVWITHEHVFSIFLLQQHGNKRPEDSPHLIFRQCDLRGKILGTVELRRQNDVLVGLLGRRPRDKSNLHLIGTGQQRLGGPFGQLEGVVLEFIGKHGTPLRIDAITPARRLGSTVGRRTAVFVERKGCHVVLLFDQTMEFGTTHQGCLFVEGKLAVPVGYARRFRAGGIVFIKERIG